MKQIQKGFTLIELMIVVAIIGILAAVAIPAYQDYIVKAKLSKITSTVDPIKLALSLYWQEQGSFPNGTIDTGTAPVAGNIWNSLGFASIPSLPQEVQVMAIDGTALTTVTIKLTLQNIKAISGTTGFDGKILGLVGSSGATAIDWACSKLGGTNFTDPIGLKYFDPKNQTCAP